MLIDMLIYAFFVFLLVGLIYSPLWLADIIEKSERKEKKKKESQITDEHSKYYEY